MIEDRKALIIALNSLQYTLGVCSRLNSKTFDLSGAGASMQAAINTINMALSHPEPESRTERAPCNLNRSNANQAPQNLSYTCSNEQDKGEKL